MNVVLKLGCWFCLAIPVSFITAYDLSFAGKDDGLGREKMTTKQKF